MNTKQITVTEIIEKYLKDNKFTALITDGCGCAIDDLFPCDCADMFQCLPGYVGESGWCYATREDAKADLREKTGTERYNL